MAGQRRKNPDPVKLQAAFLGSLWLDIEEVKIAYAVLAFGEFTVGEDGKRIYTRLPHLGALNAISERLMGKAIEMQIQVPGDANVDVDLIAQAKAIRDRRRANP